MGMTKKLWEYESQMEQMGWNHDDLYESYMLNWTISVLNYQRFYTSESVDDLNSYFIRIVKKLLDVWESIHLNIRHET